MRKTTAVHSPGVSVFHPKRVAQLTVLLKWVFKTFKMAASSSLLLALPASIRYPAAHMKWDNP